MITLENKSQKGTEYKQTEELLGGAWRTPRCCLEVDSLGGAWRTTLEGGLATPAQSLLRHRRGGSGVQCHSGEPLEKKLSENYRCFSTQQVKFWTLDPHPPTVYFKVVKPPMQLYTTQQDSVSILTLINLNPHHLF